MKDFEQIRRAWGLLLLRLTAGGMLFVHGWDKLANLTDQAAAFPDPLGLTPFISILAAVLAEAGCTALVMLGVFTRWTVLPVIFNMFVAGFVVHAGQPWARKEPAVFYAIIFVVIWLLGAGDYSFDAWLARNRSQTARKKLRTT